MATDPTSRPANRRYAKASEVEWPSVAASLRRVAERYDEDARREDAEVELEM
jgi:hypothetical protein